MRVAAGTPTLEDDGEHAAVIATDPADVTMWDERSRRRLHQAMAVLLGVEAMQIVTGHPVDDLGRRRTHVVVRAHDAAGALRRATVVAAQLHDAGLGCALLDRRDLDALVAAWRGPWRMGVRGIAGGAGHIRTYEVMRLPGGDCDPDWLATLTAATPDALISVHSRPVATDDVMRVLHRRLRDVASQQFAVEATGGIDHRADSAAAGAALIGARVAAGDAVATEVAISLALVGASAEGLATAERRLGAACAAAGLVVAPAHLRHDLVLRACLPVGDAASVRWRLTDTSAAASLVPWCHARVDDPGGYDLGTQRHHGDVVRVDPFASQMAVNANVAVIATSGHGKSHTLARLITEARRAGRDVLVLDPEGEYRSLMAAQGGTYADLGPVGGHSVNVFATGVGTGDTVAAVCDVAQLLVGGTMDRGELAVVAEAARRTLDAARPPLRPVLTDILGHLPPDARLAAVLRGHAAAGYGDFWSQRSTPPGAAECLAFGLRDVPAAMVGAITYCVAAHIWTLMREFPRPRHIVIDEAGLLADHAPLRQLIAHLARRCRKYQGSLVLATQNAADLVRTPELMVVAGNSATILLGGQRAADVATLREALSLTPRQCRFLESAGRGEFLLLRGVDRIEMRVSAQVAEPAEVNPA